MKQHAFNGVASGVRTESWWLLVLQLVPPILLAKLSTPQASNTRTQLRILLRQMGQCWVRRDASAHVTHSARWPHGTCGSGRQGPAGESCAPRRAGLGLLPQQARMAAQERALAASSWGHSPARSGAAGPGTQRTDTHPACCCRCPMGPPCRCLRGPLRPAGEARWVLRTWLPSWPLQRQVERGHQPDDAELPVVPCSRRSIAAKLGPGASGGGRPGCQAAPHLHVRRRWARWSLAPSCRPLACRRAEGALPRPLGALPQGPHPAGCCRASQCGLGQHPRLAVAGKKGSWGVRRRGWERAAGGAVLWHAAPHAAALCIKACTPRALAGLPTAPQHSPSSAWMAGLLPKPAA